MEAALGAPNPEPGLLGLGAEDADADVHHQTCGLVVQLRVHGIRVVGVHAGAFPLVEKTTEDGAGRAEEVVRLVDQVRAEIEDGAAALGDAKRGFPGRGGEAGTVPVEVGLVLEDAAQLGSTLGRRDETLDELEVTVPATVLIHADETTSLPGRGNQLIRLRRRRDKRLLREYMLPRLERSQRQVEMCVWRRGDDDDVHFRVGEELVRRGPVLHVRRVVLGRGGGARDRAALDDGVQAQGGGEFDEGDVEDFGGEAVADDTDVEDLVLGHGCCITNAVEGGLI